MARTKGKLTPQQKKFCDIYVKTLHGKNSAKAAGYLAGDLYRTAVELKAKPAVKQYIAELMEAYNDDLIAGRDEVLRYLTAVMRGELEREIYFPQIDVTKKVKPTITESNKAAEHFTKILHLIDDTLKVEAVIINDNIPKAGGSDEK